MGTGSLSAGAARGEDRSKPGGRVLRPIRPSRATPEMSLLSGGPRRATVTSSSRVAGLRIATDEVTELFAGCL